MCLGETWGADGTLYDTPEKVAQLTQYVANLRNTKGGITFDTGMRGPTHVGSIDPVQVELLRLVTGTPDVTPPTVPTGLAATGKAQAVDLAWTPSTDNGGSGVARYRLDVSLVASFASFLPGWQDKDLGLAVSTTVAGLAPNTLYFARLRAQDGAGNLSGNSVVVSTKTLADTIAPSVPTGLAAAGKAQAVDLAWAPSTDNGGSGLAGYRVDVSKTADFATFVTGWSNKDVGLATAVSVPVLTGNTLYYARVRSYDGAGNVSANVTAQARTLAGAAESVTSARSYPSPFRPGQGAPGITFDQLPTQTTVKLYTTSGVMVKTLTTDSYGQVMWDITNAEGSSVSSGVYLAVIEKDGARRVMKVMVVK
jgi:phosphodiesterase/alkaline phosphatase D-like protein